MVSFLVCLITVICDSIYANCSLLSLEKIVARSLYLTFEANTGNRISIHY